MIVCFKKLEKKKKKYLSSSTTEDPFETEWMHVITINVNNKPIISAWHRFSIHTFINENPVVRKKIRYRIDPFVFPPFFFPPPRESIRQRLLISLLLMPRSPRIVEKPIAITCLRKVFARRIAEPRN